ncbi:MAG: hypothetical protein OIF50_14745, partial [Flavobacteriaceae bacterium]|nr:hypothetical protein [Flavobacteriaceae bacterium]
MGCSKEQQPNEEPLQIQRNIQTVSLDEAKSFFLSDQKKRSNLFARGENDLRLTPDWNTLQQDELFEIDHAKLTLANVSVNRKGSYKSKLIFIKVGKQTKSAIYTIYEDEVSTDGELIRGRVFLNQTNGTFIDGYVIENGKFAKRYVVNRRQVQKAGFFLALLLQATTDDEDCWNTDNLEGMGDGVHLDNVTVTAKGGGGSSSSSDYYSLIRAWNNSQDTGSGKSGTGVGGG